MARPKVEDSKSQAFRLRADISKRLAEYSEVSHIPKTAIVEFALEEYLDKMESADKFIEGDNGE